MAGQDFSAKKVAIYGLGNQKSYPAEFIDAVFYLYEQFVQCGATIIGEWATDDYKFEASKAVIDGYFVGLALDQENQKDLTPDRLDTWLEMLVKAWD